MTPIPSSATKSFDQRELFAARSLCGMVLALAITFQLQQALLLLPAHLRSVEYHSCVVVAVSMLLFESYNQFTFFTNFQKWSSTCKLSRLSAVELCAAS